MEESITYQEIIGLGEARGRWKTLRDTLLRQGRIKFGKTGRAVLTRLGQIEDPEKLTALTDRLIHAKSWDELLDP